MRKLGNGIFILFVLSFALSVQADSATKRSPYVNDQGVLSGTKPLIENRDLSATMIAGLHRFLDRELDDSISSRAEYWKRDFKDAGAYEVSVAKNRDRFCETLGVVDERVKCVLESWSTIQTSSNESQNINDPILITQVRWPVFDGVYGEGLLLTPKGTVKANVIALPDAQQSPENVCASKNETTSIEAWAFRLAENGCRVVVPTLLSRESTFSGSTELKRATNLSHREWIWRMAFEVGRTPIGFEVQKVLSLVDFFINEENLSDPNQSVKLPVGVAGFGEGGMLALYAAAIDQRITSCWVRGYFDSRQNAWQQPVDRTTWSLLKEFGDAEIASLIAPRHLIIETQLPLSFDTNSLVQPKQRQLAAPGKITPIIWADSARQEFERAKQLAGRFGSNFFLFDQEKSKNETEPFEESCRAFLTSIKINDLSQRSSASLLPTMMTTRQHEAERQCRMVKELETYTQKIVASCERIRNDEFWSRIKNDDAKTWQQEQATCRKKFDESVIGKWERPRVPLNAQSRVAIDANGKSLLEQTAKVSAWDIKLEVVADVFAWGVLLLPKDVKADERRPVVVCQHGLEGLPEHCTTTDETSKAYSSYKAFALRLAERGFVVFVPHNPYRGGDEFRLLQRKSWLLGRHLFSLINLQHAAILDWLVAQKYVDATRIAFYGLSYGGKSAMRIPAVEERYCLSICSGDFNEWVRKNAAVDYPSSYLYTPEYEIFEWNLGHTFNYAEMAALIAPRPFMVEHGLQDRVATAEWASYEYAKVRRFYSQLGIEDRTQYEFFKGPHTIHSQGTFEFLHHHLRWPAPM